MLLVTVTTYLNVYDCHISIDDLGAPQKTVTVACLTVNTTTQLTVVVAFTWLTILYYFRTWNIGFYYHSLPNSWISRPIYMRFCGLLANKIKDRKLWGFTIHGKEIDKLNSSPPHVYSQRCYCHALRKWINADQCVTLKLMQSKCDHKICIFYRCSVISSQV